MEGVKNMEGMEKEDMNVVLSQSEADWGSCLGGNVLQEWNECLMNLTFGSDYPKTV